MFVRINGGQVVAVSRAEVLPDLSWLPVTETARPADTPTATWDPVLTVAAGLPVLGWIPRPWAAAELAAITPARMAELVAGVNGETLRSRAQAALTANASYLAIASPTTAQNAAQIKALTQQVNAVIRLALGLLDSTT